LADNHNPAAGHIFTAMITDSFNNSIKPGIPDAEPFSGNTTDISLTGNRPVKTSISGNNILRGL